MNQVVSCVELLQNIASFIRDGEQLILLGRVNKLLYTALNNDCVWESKVQLEYPQRSSYRAVYVSSVPWRALYMSYKREENAPGKLKIVRSTDFKSAWFVRNKSPSAPVVREGNIARFSYLRNKTRNKKTD